MTGPCDLLVIGASGQDGTFALRSAKDRSMHVVGTSRTSVSGLHELDPADPARVRDMCNALKPERILLLTGQSSVGRSIEEPASTIHSHIDPLLAVLEWMRGTRHGARLVYAASSEVFGTRSEGNPAHEGTVFAPANPYAVGKAAGVSILQEYRRAYGLHASAAFLFNHESTIRSERFVFGKVLAGIRRLRLDPASGPIELGDLSVVRDWGYAPDYAAAMLDMLNCDEPGDLVLATGRSVTLGEAVAALLETAGLDPDNATQHSTAGTAPRKLPDAQYADPSRAMARIGWSGSVGFPDLARVLVADLH